MPEDGFLKFGAPAHNGHQMAHQRKAHEAHSFPFHGLLPPGLLPIDVLLAAVAGIKGWTGEMNAIGAAMQGALLNNC